MTQNRGVGINIFGPMSPMLLETSLQEDLESS